jgi:hypothetical protein
MHVSSSFTERDGRQGPPAGNKAKCNCTNTPLSKATQHKAKPNQTPTTQPTDGSRDRPRQPQPRAFADPAGRPRRRREDDAKSESDRVRGKEVGMVSNQMEAGRHAQE